jgi:hypothetical protein
MDLSISPFSALRFCFMHFEALLFDAYISRIVIPSSGLIVL